MVLWEEDFSEVYAAIDALKEAGVQDFRTYFIEHPDVVAELAAKIRILDVNDYAVQLFKATSKENLLTSIDRLFDAETYPMFVEQLTAFANQVDPFSCESYVRALDGERLHILFTVAMLSDPNSRGRGLVTMVDISARKKMEESLRVMNAELKRSNQELEQFAYVASHDLQEPLRKIRSYGELLEGRCQDQLDERTSKYVASMVGAARRMQSLINDLLSLSRVGTSGRPLQATDSTRILVNVIENMQVSIRESGAKITYDPLPRVMVDATLLGQLLQNLVGNGIKFRGDIPSHVHVSARRSGDEWVFSVQDNGIGIEPQYMQDIFVVFKRLHGRDQYPGTGIGLAIVKKIAEYHQGRVWVESKAGQGSTFYFTLPVRAGEGKEPA